MTKTSNYAKTPAHAGEDKTGDAMRALEDRISDLEARLAAVKGVPTVGAPATEIRPPFSFNDVELSDDDVDALLEPSPADEHLVVVEKPQLVAEIPVPAYRHHVDAPPPLVEPDPEPEHEDDTELAQALAIADIEEVHRKALAEVTTIALAAGLLITFYDFPHFTEGGVE